MLTFNLSPSARQWCDSIKVDAFFFCFVSSFTQVIYAQVNLWVGCTEIGERTPYLRPQLHFWVYPNFGNPDVSHENDESAFFWGF